MKTEENTTVLCLFSNIKSFNMSAPYIHAQSSVKKYGGVPDDYIDIHILLDSTKSAFSDNRHRVLTHNSWFSTTIIPLVFGHVRINSDGKQYNTKDIAEQHILEDYRHKFIPTLQDWIEHLPYAAWMNNAITTLPRLAKKGTMVKTDITDFDFQTTTID